MTHREQSAGASDEWYTPPHVFKAMDRRFDVDVASPGAAITPWIPARRFIKGGSLERDWADFGFIWMNPPFGGRGNKTVWLRKFFEHGNGVALVPDRTSAPWWREWIDRADLCLFVAPKLKFIPGNGQHTSAPAQGTALLAIGSQGCQALSNARNAGLGTLMRTCR